MANKSNKVKRRDLKFLFHSNAIYTGSGYATESRDILLRLKKDGWNFAFVANHGVESYPVDIMGIKHYPRMIDAHGSDAIYHHAIDFGAQVVFTMLDAWILDINWLKQLQAKNIKWIPWIPIDQEPTNPGTIQNIKTAYKILTFSKFGQQTLEKEGFASTLILEGIDTDIFKPMDKAQMRKKIGIPNDIFLFGMIGANKENPPRKGYQEAMDAFKLFSNDHPEARLFFHCQQLQAGGFPIMPYAQYLGIQDKVLYLDQYRASFNSDSHNIAEELNMLDVLLHPSMTEGFGLLSIESQACFTGDTPISVDNVCGFQKREFSGEIIEICTDNGLIKCTPEHPFYTNKGWVKAGDLTTEYHLLYNNNYVKKGIYRGRIEDVFNNLSIGDTQEYSKDYGEDIQSSPLAQIQIGIQKDNEGKDKNEKNKSFSGRVVLPGWFDRRRRASDNKKNEWWENKRFKMETDGFHNKQFKGIDELVKRKNKNPFFLYRKEKSPTNEKQTGGLFIPHGGNRISAVFPEYFAISGNKEEKNGINNKVDRNKNEPRKQRGSKPSQTIQNSSASKTFKLVKIKKIQRYRVNKISVYNFTTKSSVYLASGFLVHNCGVPPIVNRCTSMPELVVENKTGWICETQKAWWRNGGGYTWFADTNSLHEKMEDLYKKLKSKNTIAKDCRENILTNFNIDSIVKNKWIPFLENLQEEILPKEANQ